MILRSWRGTVRTEDLDTYVRYVRETGIKGLRETDGNQGAWILTRETDGRSDLLVLSLWDSVEAVYAFAGDDPDRAVFYPEDDRYLLDRDDFACNWTVAKAGGDGSSA